MSISWFLTFLIGIQALCLYVGYRASKKHKSQADYYLAGKNLTFFPLLMTFVATQVGGGLILGSAEEAYRLGWKIIFYPLGYISGFFLLSTSLGSRLASLPVATVAQVFEVCYESKTLKKLASALSIFTLLMITVAQVLASQKILGNLHVDSLQWVLLFWAVIFLYTMWAGMDGIASIDAIQALFFLVALGASAIPLVMNSNLSEVNWMATSQLPQEASESPWIAWFLMPCLFMLIEQDMAQRCFSAKSTQVVRRAALSSAILIFLVSLVPILFGLLGRAENIPVKEGNSVLLTVVEATTSPFITAAVSCAIMMAIISTAVSLIHSVSSNLAQDFDFSWNRGPNSVWISKLMTLGIGIFALGISYFFKNIVTVLIQSYELSVVCLFVPVFVSLFNRRGNKLAAALAILFGGCSFVLCRAYPPSFPREIIELVSSSVGFISGTIIAQISSVSTRLKNEEVAL